MMQRTMLTGTHVVHATSAELCAHFIGGSQTKVSDSQTKTVVKTEDVLRLQVAVEYPLLVTVCHRVQDLQEDGLGELVVPEEHLVV